MRCAQNTGIMFLNEVVLGKEHEIIRDDSSLRKAPDGYDSVVARGHTEPGECLLYLSMMLYIISIITDPKEDTTLTIDSNAVTVPQGKPIKMEKYSSSSFSQVCGNLVKQRYITCSCFCGIIIDSLLGFVLKFFFIA